MHGRYDRLLRCTLHFRDGSFTPIPLVRPTHARSAAPPIAGIKLTPNDRCLVPIAVVSRCSKDAPQKTRRNLLNHLVGGGEQCRRNREAECLRRVQIYDEIELCRLLDRNVGRLRPAQNLIDVISGAPKKIRVVWSKGNQTSRFYVISRSMNRRQSRADRQYVDSNSVGACERVGTDIKRLAGGP